MITLPTSVRVAAFDVTIEDWTPIASHAAGRFGEFSNLEMLIRVDSSVNPMKVLDTLIHEINHAIYWAYGIEDEDKEERIVGTMATAWAQIYRDNPDLLRFIGEVCNHTSKPMNFTEMPERAGA